MTTIRPDTGAREGLGPVIGVIFGVILGTVAWALIALLVFAVWAAAADGATARPQTFVGCQVRLTVDDGKTKLTATGLLNVWETLEPGYEYAEMYGTVDGRNTGPVVVETTRPPLDLEVISCPWRAPDGFSDGGDGPSRPDLIAPERKRRGVSSTPRPADVR